MAEQETKEALFNYCLRLADDSLILGHRLSEWCGHGPILEEDIAMINIALDLIGQSRSLYQYAGEVEGKGRTEDDLAYLRDPKDFKNALLVEQPNGDFAVTIVRQFFFTAFSYNFYQELKNSKDSTLSAIAEKSLKEITYHLRHCSQWMIRLGDGTEESKKRMTSAVNELYKYTADLFEATGSDDKLIQAGIAVDLKKVHLKWLEMVGEVFERATLVLPKETSKLTGGREGNHSELLTVLLDEMQVLPRTYPGTSW